MKFANKTDRKSVTLFDVPTNTRYAESFRTLRTNLNFSSMDQGLSSVLVTSTVEAEGKTSTTVNLGYTIAQSGSRVLLIDADLRKHGLTTLFKLKKSKGFTEIISESFTERFSKGNLKDYSIGDLLQLMKLQKRTGELNINSNNKQIAIYFIDGQVDDIFWKNRPEKKKLANSLVQKKILTEKEAVLALGHQKKSVQRLGTILFSMGLVSKEKLIKELAVHTIEVMRLTSGMKEGEFYFRPLSREQIQSPISQNVNFTKLFREFLGQREDLLFIKKAVASSIYPTETKNLFVLPSGKVPHNPSDLVGSKGAAFLIELLKNKFDFIILDTPPVMPATDAMQMAPRVDGTVFVVKAGNTERKFAKRAVDDFKKADLPVLGVVLNAVDLEKEGYYRYYKKYYSSYYGD